MTLELTAFSLITSTGVVTVASTIAAVTSDTKEKAIACGMLALLGSSASLSSVSAYFSPSSQDVKSYLHNMKAQFGYTTAGIVTYIAQSIFNGAIQGIQFAITRAVSDKMDLWIRR